MDASVLDTPVVTDREALQEFIDALIDLAPKIERDVAQLKATPGDRELVADLFRAVHNIKGDAAMCKVPIAIRIAHPIETVLARFRAGEIVFSDVLAEAVLLAIDRLEMAVDCLANDKSLASLRLDPLIEGLEALAASPPAQCNAAASAIIEAVTGFRSVSAASVLVAARSKLSSISPDSHSRLSEDLRFFRSLAKQLEMRSPMFKGRTMRVLRLALETNKEAKKPIDPVQLEAAVYMHDVGMMFLPESIWLKVGRIGSEEKLILQEHPDYGAGILGRISGWEAAAEIVEQHHEMPDGAGYPRALKANRICEGANILAIVDAFEAVMLKHIHRGKNRSVLRAIAEVNACDKQFAPAWIEPFNRVIRRTVEA